MIGRPQTMNYSPNEFLELSREERLLRGRISTLKKMIQRREDKIDELMKPVVVSGLAPPDLVDGAQKLDVNLGNLTADEDALKRGITNAKRLQISGGGTKYEMTLQKVREGRQQEVVIAVGHRSF